MTLPLSPRFVYLGRVWFWLRVCVYMLWVTRTVRVNLIWVIQLLPLGQIFSWKEEETKSRMGKCLCGSVVTCEMLRSEVVLLSVQTCFHAGDYKSGNFKWTTNLISSVKRAWFNHFIFFLSLPSPFFHFSGVSSCIMVVNLMLIVVIKYKKIINSFCLYFATF